MKITKENLKKMIIEELEEMTDMRPKPQSLQNNFLGYTQKQIRNWQREQKAKAPPGRTRGVWTMNLDDAAEMMQRAGVRPEGGIALEGALNNPDSAEPKQHYAVGQATKKMEKAPGLEAYMQQINNRVKLEQFIANVVKLTSDKISPQDIYAALTRTARKLQGEIKQ